MSQDSLEWAQAMKLARAYVRPQRYTQRFDPLEGLKNGTIFPELVSPYTPPAETSHSHEEALG